MAVYAPITSEEIVIVMNSICNRMGLRAIKDSFHEYFQSFHKIRDEGNLKHFDNRSEINS